MSSSTAWIVLGTETEEAREITGTRRDTRTTIAAREGVTFDRVRHVFA